VNACSINCYEMFDLNTRQHKPMLVLLYIGRVGMKLIMYNRWIL